MNANNVDYDMLENVKQPRLAKTLIKLSEVYREVYERDKHGV